MKRWLWTQRAVFLRDMLVAGGPSKVQDFFCRGELAVRPYIHAFTFAILLLLLTVTGAGAQNDPLNVVATTTIIADVARNVGGDLVDVTSLVPPNADVHAFEPSPDDAVRIAEADVLSINGAGLEAFLNGLLENAGGVEPVVVSNGVLMLPFGGHPGEVPDPVGSDFVGVLGEAGVCEEHHDEETTATEGEEHEHGSCDPHVWTDPNNVIVWTANIADAFAAADPENADTYRTNADAYIQQIEALDAEVEQILSVIPAERRILVTNHEFFGYFAHRYGFEVVGVVVSGGTTLAEPNPQELAALVTIVEEEGVPAIFAEVSHNAQLAEVVAAETGINVVTTLYSDSLSEPGGPADTYLNYLRYNAQTIAAALTE
jgi:ABC-type Zn uptake system ZnuABC Zn-binding protein ZnuA